MALTIADVRADLALAITTGCGLRTSVFESDNINTPVGIVSLADFDPHMVFGDDTISYPFRVTLFTGAVSTRSAQTLIDSYRELAGSTSLTLAVETSSNWTETVDYARVRNNGQPEQRIVNDQLVWAAEFEIEVVF